jgi:hypothetical protein
LNVLFTGPYGLRKTAAAEVSANSLSLTPLQIDLPNLLPRTRGNIKNEPTNGSVPGSPQRDKIGMVRTILAVKIDLQKQGRSVTESDFARFFEAVQKAEVEGVA